MRPILAVLLLAAGVSADCGDSAEVARGTGAPGDARWRRCELEGPLACEGPDTVCDMYRNACVPVCEGEGCCKDVECPARPVCTPHLGRCAVPAGDGCYDMGEAWWTGRDLPPEQRRSPVEPVPTVFVIRNATDGLLFFESTMDQPARFDLFRESSGEVRKLELAENHYCPTTCPQEGRAMELDCGAPPRIAHRLPPGESLSVRWTGREQVGMRRICDGPPGQFCYVRRVTVPGAYTVEVCAHSAARGTSSEPDLSNRLVGVTVAGERTCVRETFRHPERATVEVRFGR